MTDQGLKSLKYLLSDPLQKSLLTHDPVALPPERCELPLPVPPHLSSYLLTSARLIYLPVPVPEQRTAKLAKQVIWPTLYNPLINF